MKRDDVFDLWAPGDSVWSPWVKPVLFSHMPIQEPAWMDLSFLRVSLSWLPPPDAGTALILDLPGPMGVTAGLAAAEWGYRPVPLFNALPDSTELDEGWQHPEVVAGKKYRVAMVDVIPIMRGLWHGAKNLANLKLSPEAPPAFILDANRRTGAGPLDPGRFDNRSMCFQADFPSAEKLRQHSVRTVLVVDRGKLDKDLAHILYEWQSWGISLLRKGIDTSGPPVSLRLRRPSLLGWRVFEFLAWLGLRGNAIGGFGGIIPETSTG